MSAQKSTTPKWVAYLAWWVTGLIFLATEKQDEDIRWHSANSIAIFGGVSVVQVALGILSFIPIINILFGIVSWLLWAASVVLWILLMVKAANGERIRIPFLTDFAEKNLLNLFK